MTDLNGRVVSSTTDSPWDETERAWMLARQAYRREALCSLCGMPKEVCRAMDTEGKVAIDFERCHVTAELTRKQRVHQRDGVLLPESLAYTASVRT